MINMCMRIIVLAMLLSCSAETKITDKRPSKPALEQEADQNPTIEIEQNSSDVVIETADISPDIDEQTEEKELGEAPVFAFTEAIAIEQNLGTVSEYEYTISSQNYSGPVSLTVDREKLNEVDAESDITITVEPSKAELSNGSVKVKVMVNVSMMSPSITGKALDISLKVTTPDEDGEAQLDIPVTVNPVFEISMSGNNPVTYSPDISEFNFRPHEGGMKFIIKKPDMVNIVHGNGDIPHQRIQTPSPDYEVTFMPDINDCSGSFYSHNNEGGGDRRIVNCNVQ